MKMATSDTEDECLQKLKNIASNTISNMEMFNQAMNFWCQDTPRPMLDVIAKAKMHTSELMSEVAAQESVAKQLDQSESVDAELDKANAHLRDLEKQEAALKQQMQDMEHKMKKLKLFEEENKESKIKNKLEVYRNLAKISKKLTGAKFDYQGPNISGVIINKEHLEVFNFKPAEISEKDAVNHLWKCLELVSGENWSNVVTDANVKHT